MHFIKRKHTFQSINTISQMLLYLTTSHYRPWLPSMTVIKILSPLTPYPGSKVKYIYFAMKVLIKYWNLACKKRYNKYETYQTRFMFEGLGPPPWVGLGQNSIHIFQNRIMLHIKLKRMTHAATCQRIFYPKTPRPWGWSQRSKFHFLEHVHVAYQTRGHCMREKAALKWLIYWWWHNLYAPICSFDHLLQSFAIIV